MTRALVTGATGFLGSHLAHRLVGLGYEVTALGRNAAVGRALESAGMRFVACDLADREAVVAACGGQDVVYHSGALSSPWGAYEQFYAANVRGTSHVIEGCFQAGVRRLIHVSTPSLYFDFQDRLGIREDAPLPRRFVNAYAETKRLAEIEVEKAHAQGLPVISIRPRAIFGPGETAIMPRLIRASRKGFLPLFGDEATTIDLTVVDNVVDALLLCEHAPVSALGRHYNITNGEPVRLAEFLPRIFETLGIPCQPRRIPYDAALAMASGMEFVANAVMGGREPVLTRYAVGVLGKSQTLDITAAREQLGYAPGVSMAEGVEAYARWFREQPKNG